MGKLVWAAIGFAAAALGAEYLLPTQGLPFIAAALVVLAPLTRFCRGRRRPALLLTLSAAVGLLCWWTYYTVRVAPCEVLAGQTVTITARVTEYPQENENVTRVDVRVVDGAPHQSACLYMYYGTLPELSPGDIITAEVRLSSVMQGQNGRARSLTSDGISMRGYFADTVTVCGRWSWSWLYFPQRIARGVKNMCTALFPDRIAVFMTALLTGDKQQLYADAELYGGMRQAGLLHAVAVSGMHIIVLVSFVQLMLGRGRRTSFICLPVLAVFVLMAGAGASVVRAAVMQAVFLGAPLFGRESDGPSGVAAALLVLLGVNPMAVGGVGLQLSFACVLGFMVLMPPLERRIAGLTGFGASRPVQYVLSSFACTLCATVFSIPVSAAYFGTVPLLSPLANLLTLGVIEVLFAGGYVVCAIGAIVPAVGKLLGWVLGWGVRWCFVVFRFIGRLPYACLYTVDPWVVVWLVFSYVLLGAYFVLRRRGRVITPAIPAALCLLGLCAVFLVSSLRLRAGRRELVVLDVGQGECVAAFDADSAVVVDCGGSGLTNAGDTAADYLLAAGIRHIDTLVLTHLHEDHTNGVLSLCARMPVEHILLPADTDDADGMLAEILRAAESTGAEVTFVQDDAAAVVGDMELSLMLPQAGTDKNERGIVVCLRSGGATTLLMGDAGTDAELALIGRGTIPDADILVVGHHGSKTASGAMFLRCAAPETAIISVGYNSYGLPNEEVLARLDEYCGRVYRTDTDATVSIDLREYG